MIRFSIIDAADQQFATILNRRRVTIRLCYNVTTDRWSMDLSIDDLPVLHGLRIVTGIDLLQAYDLDIGVIFALATVAGEAPDRDGLPSGLVRLYHASVEEFEQAKVRAEMYPELLSNIIPLTDKKKAFQISYANPILGGVGSPPQIIEEGTLGSII